MCAVSISASCSLRCSLDDAATIPSRQFLLADLLPVETIAIMSTKVKMNPNQDKPSNTMQEHQVIDLPKGSSSRKKLINGRMQARKKINIPNEKSVFNVRPPQNPSVVPVVGH